MRRGGGQNPPKKSGILFERSLTVSPPVADRQFWTGVSERAAGGVYRQVLDELGLLWLRRHGNSFAVLY